MKEFSVEKINNLWHFIVSHQNGRREYKESFKTKGEALRAMELHIRAEKLHQRKIVSDTEA